MVHSPFGPISPDTEWVLRAAHLYYVQNMTMAAIGRELGTSRSTISRLISEARATGVVNIQINFTTTEMQSAKAALEEEFGIKAEVVPIAQPDNRVEVDERVAMASVKYLTDSLASNMSLGFAHTPLTQLVGERLPQTRIHHTKIVEMTGRFNDQTTIAFRNDYVMSRIGMALNARVYLNPFPLFLDSPETKRALAHESSMKAHQRELRSVDICLFSINPMRSASVPINDTFTLVADDDYSMLTQAGVVGELAGRFFRADGNDRNVPMNARSCALALEDLLAIPRRICMVSGREALLAVRGALHVGVITDLVIDEPTAVWLANRL